VALLVVVVVVGEILVLLPRRLPLQVVVGVIVLLLLLRRLQEVGATVLLLPADQAGEVVNLLEAAGDAKDMTTMKQILPLPLLLLLAVGAQHQKKQVLPEAGEQHLHKKLAVQQEVWAQHPKKQILLEVGAQHLYKKVAIQLEVGAQLQQKIPAIKAQSRPNQSWLLLQQLLRYPFQLRHNQSHKLQLLQSQFQFLSRAILKPWHRNQFLLKL